MVPLSQKCAAMVLLSQNSRSIGLKLPGSRATGIVVSPSWRRGLISSNNSVKEIVHWARGGIAATRTPLAVGYGVSGSGTSRHVEAECQDSSGTAECFNFTSLRPSTSPFTRRLYIVDLVSCYTSSADHEIVLFVLNVTSESQCQITQLRRGKIW